MQRLPFNLITNKQLTTTLTDTTYTVPANTTLTVAALSFNNTTGTGRTVTANAYPGGGAAAAGNEFLSALSVPAAGSAPTTSTGLVGHSFPAGTVFVFKADAATAVSINFSGYLTTA